MELEMRMGWGRMSGCSLWVGGDWVWARLVLLLLLLMLLFACGPNESPRGSRNGEPRVGVDGDWERKMGLEGFWEVDADVDEVVARLLFKLLNDDNGVIIGLIPGKMGPIPGDSGPVDGCAM